MKEFFKPIDHVTASKVNDVPRTRAIRLYCYQSGSAWNLQVRGPLSLVDNREGKDFIVATANLKKADLLALRAAIDEALSDA